uniref:Uncharacterized protein n=1 Tax=Caulobacter sp. (strain K31) TaxID=366602 RepID=B0SYL0_CAUSK
MLPPMAESLEQLIDRLRAVEAQIEAAFAARAAQHAVEHGVERDAAGKPCFKADALRRQKAHRKTLGLARTPWPTLLTMPLIYGMALPLFILDVSVSVYQLGCFTAWGIARVKRSDYVVIDRHRLGYLNPVQKLNCVFCGYGNGVIAFAREVTARTEQYWCPIKHALKVKGSHDRYAAFQAYGDAEGFVKSSPAYRERLKRGE